MLKVIILITQTVNKNNPGMRITIISAAAMTYCLAPVVKATHGVDLKETKAMDELADTILQLIFGGILAASAQ